VPSKPTAVKTEVNNMNVKISWTAGNSNYKQIDGYKILIKNIATS